MTRVGEGGEGGGWENIDEVIMTTMLGLRCI